MSAKLCGRRRRSGLSLMELVISLFICSLASVALVVLFKSTTNAQNEVLYPNTANSTARQAMDIFTDRLRGATAITVADASDITYTDSSGNTDKYWISNSNLVMSTNGSPSAGTVVAYGVTSLSLTYWWWNGSAWTSTGTPTLGKIGAVDVTLNTVASGYAATLVSSVRIRDNTD
jgi:Tfp pilus assembly protein PilW